MFHVKHHQMAGVRGEEGTGRSLFQVSGDTVTIQVSNRSRIESYFTESLP